MRNLRVLQRQLGWRMVSRHRVRSLVLAVAIALPVAIAVCLASLANTAVTTDDEMQTMTFGQAQARLTELRHTNVKELLPTSAHAVADQTYAGMPIRAAGGREATAKGRALDLTDPLVRDMFVVREGQVSHDPHTIALSVGLAKALNVRTGDTVQVAPQHQPMTVSAVLAFPRIVSDTFFVSPSPITVTGPSRADIVGTRNWLVDTDVDPVAADKAGVAVSARRHTTAPEDSLVAQGLSLALAVGLLAECLLLVSAALSMIARSETRTAALMAAMGVPERSRWRFLSDYVWVLTALAVTGGTASGLMVAHAMVGPLQDRSDADWGAFAPAWIVMGVIVSMTLLSVPTVAWGSARRMRRVPLMDLLSNTPATRQAASRRHAVGAGTMFLASAAVLLLGHRSPTWSAACSLGGAVGASAALVWVLVLLLHRLARRPDLTGPATFTIAIRHLTASTSRSLLTATALSVIVCVCSFMQVSAQMVVDSAERNRSTPVLEGWSLVEVHRPLTSSEIGVLPAETRAFAWATSGPNAEQIAPRTDALQCISKNITFYADGHVDPAPCIAASQSKVPFPQLAVATSADMSVLARLPMTPAEAAAYDRGDFAAVSGPTGVNGPLALVTRDVVNGRMVLKAVGQVPAREAQDATDLSQMPTAYISPAAQRKLHLTALDPRYLVHSSNVEAIKNALSPDVATDAQVTTNEASPFLAPARAMKTVVGVTATATACLILLAMLALWSSELTPARQMLTALGARRRWLRTTSATLAVTLATIATLAGTATGIFAAWLFTHDSGAGTPWTWAPVLTSITVLAGAAAIGSITVPRSATLHRRA